MKKLFLVAILFTLIGCSTASLRVESSPDGADVIASTADKTPVKIGKTPLTIDASQVSELYREPLSILLEKKGYQPYGILIPRTTMKSQSRMFITLKSNEGSNEGQKFQDAANDLAFGVARALNLMTTRDLDEAESLLMQLASKYPNVSVIYDLLGNNYYIKKNVKNYKNNLHGKNKFIILQCKNILIY